MEQTSFHRSHFVLIVGSPEIWELGSGKKEGERQLSCVPVVAFRVVTESQPLGLKGRQFGVILLPPTICAKSAFPDRNIGTPCKAFQADSLSLLSTKKYTKRGGNMSFSVS